MDEEEYKIVLYINKKSKRTSILAILIIKKKLYVEFKTRVRFTDTFYQL